MYLLDTNHCSQAFNGNSQILHRLATIGRERVGTSVVVQAELHFMAFHSRRTNENLATIADFLGNLATYLIDDSVAYQYGRLKAALMEYFGPKERAKRRQFELRQLGLSDNDLWIAATAIQNDLIVVTSDSDFSRIAQVTALRHETWLRNDLTP